MELSGYSSLKNYIKNVPPQTSTPPCSRFSLLSHMIFSGSWCIMTSHDASRRNISDVSQYSWCGLMHHDCETSASWALVIWFFDAWLLLLMRCEYLQYTCWCVIHITDVSGMLSMSFHRCTVACKHWLCRMFISGASLVLSHLHCTRWCIRHANDISRRPIIGIHGCILGSSWIL